MIFPRLHNDNLTSGSVLFFLNSCRLQTQKVTNYFEHISQSVHFAFMDSTGIWDFKKKNKCINYQLHISSFHHILSWDILLTLWLSVAVFCCNDSYRNHEKTCYWRPKGSLLRNCNLHNLGEVYYTWSMKCKCTNDLHEGRKCANILTFYY